MSLNSEIVYHSQMTEAKLRILSAERVAFSSVSATGLSSLDIEFCFLQIRKVVELITFGAMVREEKRYRAFRKNESEKQDPTTDWKATKILAKLVQLSPHMIPISLGASSTSSEEVVNFDRASEQCNHEKLIEIYEQCSDFMHVFNPLVPDFNKTVQDWRDRYDSANPVVIDYLKFLRGLLWFHAAITLDWNELNDPTTMDNPRYAWLVDFRDPDDKIVKMSLSVAQ